MSENPQWILNDTVPLNTGNSQKYEVDNAVPGLTVKNLTYEDVGHYFCHFAGSNVSADSIELIGVYDTR